MNYLIAQLAVDQDHWLGFLFLILGSLNFALLGWARFGRLQWAKAYKHPDSIRPEYLIK
jgi:hypothetical protein